MATNRESDHVIPDGCRDGCEHETLPADGPPVEDRLLRSGDGSKARWMTRRFQSRPGGAWETTRKRGLYRRLTLRRADGLVYLNRWALTLDRIGGIKVHRMDAPDPGIDLHDHPWPFVSVILWGGYSELRASIRDAARLAEAGVRGERVYRRPLSVKVMRLDECHTITDLSGRVSWSLVITGRRRRKWGFYLPTGYMPEAEYDATVRAERRDLWSDQKAANRPWETSS